MCLSVCLDVFVCFMGMPSAHGAERGNQIHWTGVTDGLTRVTRCWTLNSGPLQQQVLLTAEVSLQPLLLAVTPCCRPLFSVMVKELTLCRMPG